ncbi:hypothetical protein F0562_008882 [Nyssa sinensis]|uniref:Cation/H+ exchanger domain-containing protein n=1 Tax=Nyssa sinensis TaxID=561372 RepID=A0A5J5A9B7_9ASTE|nr:hypothetical protein F0562_008882 [Nyssa sinensis]
MGNCSCPWRFPIPFFHKHRSWSLCWAFDCLCVLRLVLRQAYACSNLFYCRNIYISLCGNGCYGHSNVEDEQIKFTSYGVTMDPVNATMVTITIIIVLFSTIVFGFLTKPLISYLLPQHANNSGIHREPTLHKEELRLPLLSLEESAATNTFSAEGSLSMLIEMPVYTIHYYWRKFDNTYMRPIFGGPESF